MREKIDWCRANDDACRAIARNALAIYNSFVSRDGVLDYMQCVFVEISKVGSARPPSTHSYPLN